MAVLSAVIVTVVVVASPEASPLQFTNSYPAIGLAVTVTILSGAYKAASGFFVTLPVAAGNTAVVNEYTPQPQLVGLLIVAPAPQKELLTIAFIFAAGVMVNV